jgi:hypothetical protein
VAGAFSGVCNCQRNASLSEASPDGRGSLMEADINTGASGFNLERGGRTTSSTACAPGQSNVSSPNDSLGILILVIVM